MTKKIIALLLLLFATPSFAQSYSGTTDGLTPLIIPIPAGPGSYQLSFAFSAPQSFDLTIFSETHYDFYDADTGEYQGGDDAFIYDNHQFYAPVTAGIVQWTIAPPYTYTSGNLITTGYYEGIDATFNFYTVPTFAALPEFTYSVSITAVPEPAQWALLIGGFAFGGAALRRRAGKTRAMAA